MMESLQWAEVEYIILWGNNPNLIKIFRPSVASELGTDTEESAAPMILVLHLQSCHPLLVGCVSCPCSQVFVRGSSGTSPAL